MPNQHRWPPHTLRIAGPLWDRAVAFAQRTGQTVTAVISAALGEYLDTHDRNERSEPSDTGDEEEQG
jgi:hypothetical protein